MNRIPKKEIVTFSVIFLGLIFGLASSNFADNVFAQTNVGVGVDVESETEVKVGSEKESSASSETRAEVTTEAKSETSQKQESKEEMKISSESNTESKSQAQLSIKTSYPKMTASSDNSFVVQSKQRLYAPGDSIKIEGAVWSSLMAQLDGSDTIEIQVMDAKGQIVSENTVQISQDGSFEGDVKIPQSSASGEYTIKSKIVADSSLLGSLSSHTKASLESSTRLVVSTPSTVMIKVEGHDDFEVKVASNSKVSTVEFKENEKKVSFTVEGETGTQGTTQITIPKALLSGQMTVMIDGQVMASDDVIVTSNTETSTTLELNYHHSTHQIDIVGTNAVPEFGTIAALILVAAIASIIIVSTRTRLSIMPRY